MLASTIFFLEQTGKNGAPGFSPIINRPGYKFSPGHTHQLTSSGWQVWRDSRQSFALAFHPFAPSN